MWSWVLNHNLVKISGLIDAKLARKEANFSRAADSAHLIARGKKVTFGPLTKHLRGGKCKRVAQFQLPEQGS